jgi:hypothetical protein
MSQEITDLDASGVIHAAKKVRLHGEVYTLPGDIPAPLFVQLMAFAENPGLEDAAALYREILALFRVHQPELETIPLGLNELTHAVGFIYNGAAVTGDDGDEEGPTPPKPSSKKKTAAGRSRSRSST